MRPPIDLEELADLVDLPDRLFVWSLNTASGEVMPGPDDSGQVVPLPQLSEPQIMNWMCSFAAQCSETRMQALLATALKHPAPKVRFHQVLSVNPQGQKEWMDFLNQKRRAVVLDWLSSLGLSPPEPQVAREPGE